MSDIQRDWQTTIYIINYVLHVAQCLHSGHEQLTFALSTREWMQMNKGGKVASAYVIAYAYVIDQWEKGLWDSND